MKEIKSYINENFLQETPNTFTDNILGLIEEKKAITYPPLISPIAIGVIIGGCIAMVLFLVFIPVSLPQKIEWASFFSLETSISKQVVYSILISLVLIFDFTFGKKLITNTVLTLRPYIL